MKKSLMNAIDEALKLSYDNPDITYCVLNKSRGKAVCLSVPFIIRNYILFSGYYTYCKVTNGTPKYMV